MPDTLIHLRYPARLGTQYTCRLLASTTTRWSLVLSSTMSSICVVYITLVDCGHEYAVMDTIASLALNICLGPGSPFGLTHLLATR